MKRPMLFVLLLLLAVPAAAAEFCPVCIQWCVDWPQPDPLGRTITCGPPPDRECPCVAVCWFQLDGNLGCAPYCYELIFQDGFEGGPAA